MLLMCSPRLRAMAPRQTAAPQATAAQKRWPRSFTRESLSGRAAAPRGVGGRGSGVGERSGRAALPPGVRGRGSGAGEEGVASLENCENLYSWRESGVAGTGFVGVKGLIRFGWQLAIRAGASGRGEVACRGN